MKAVWLEAYLSGVEKAQLKLLWFRFLTLEWLFLSSMREDSNDFIICFLDFISHVIILLINLIPSHKYLYPWLNFWPFWLLLIFFESSSVLFMDPYFSLSWILPWELLDVTPSMAWGHSPLPLQLPLTQVSWERGVCMNAGVGVGKWNKFMKGNIELLMHCNYQMILSRLWWVPVGFIAILTVVFPLHYLMNNVWANNPPKNPSNNNITPIHCNYYFFPNVVVFIWILMSLY